MVELNIINLHSEHGTLIRIIGEILALVYNGNEVASERTCSRLIDIIEKIRKNVDADSLQTAFSLLEPGAQQALASALH